MSDLSAGKSSPLVSAKAVPILVMAFLAAIWIFHLAAAMGGYPLFRDQHLGGALMYARNGIDLLHPIVPGFNAAGTPTPLEFPIWQALASLALKATGEWWGAANIVTLLLFSTALIPLFLLARREMGSAGAWWTLLFFLAQPVVVFQAGLASTDAFCLATMVWFLYCADRFMRGPSWGNFALALFTAFLCAISKAPFFIAAGLACAVMLVWNYRNKGGLPAWAGIVLVGGASMVLMIIWTRHIDACLEMAEFRYRGVSLHEIPAFYFGDLAYHLNPRTYIRAGWIFLNAMCGSFILVLVPLVGLWLARKSWAQAMVIGFLLVTLVFFKLVTTHKHYYLMLTPAVAMLGATTVVACLKRWDLGQSWKASAFAAVTAIGLSLSTAQGLIGLEVTGNFDPYPQRIADKVARLTSPKDRLLMANGGWGGDIFLRSRRDGLTINSTKQFDTPEKLRRLQELGYTRFVSLSESPLLNALQQTNPGSLDRERDPWSNFTSPIDVSWPIEYQDNDLIIKRIVYPQP